jgi:very-short-patch-repair endonuclease
MHQAAHPWARVAEVAAAQYGVVSFAQLRAVGLGRGAVEKAVRGERLIRLHTGVYAVGHRVLRVEGHRLAAVLACGDGAVLSHRSAAGHWGLLPTARTLVDVTTPRTRRRVPGIDVHRSRSLDAKDATTHERIPITTIARTLLDLAATVPENGLERALAQAERRQLYDQRAITDVIARNNGHRGSGALTRATAQEPKLTRSELEAMFLALVRRAGLPEPLSNHVLADLDHQRHEVDFYFPAHRLVVELDGWDTHRTKAAFKSDRRRDAALTSIGYRVMRFTYDDVVHDADTVVTRLRRRSAPA